MILKVIGIAAIHRATYHFLLVVCSNDSILPHLWPIEVLHVRALFNQYLTISQKQCNLTTSYHPINSIKGNSSNDPNQRQWVTVLRPTRHKVDHFRDALPSRSLG